MDTMNVFPTDPVLAQQQADALQGNARKSLSEMSGAVTHAVWYFARVKDTLPPRPTTATEPARAPMPLELEAVVLLGLLDRPPPAARLRTTTGRPCEPPLSVPAASARSAIA